MLSEKRGLNQENLVDTSILLDAVISLINIFKHAGHNPPINIRVDKRAFDKLLEEASRLYSSINVKNSIYKSRIFNSRQYKYCSCGREK